MLDTKYKASETPLASDMEQVVAYAVAKNCKRAALIYPVTMPGEGALRWGPDIEVEALGFPLGVDIEEAGRQLMHRIVGQIEQPD